MCGDTHTQTHYGHGAAEIVCVCASELLNKIKTNFSGYFFLTTFSDFGTQKCTFDANKKCSSDTSKAAWLNLVASTGTVIFFLIHISRGD